jgi:hypothetical protein
LVTESRTRVSHPAAERTPGGRNKIAPYPAVRSTVHAGQQLRDLDTD